MDNQIVQIKTNVVLYGGYEVTPIAEGDENSPLRLLLKRGWQRRPAENALVPTRDVTVLGTGVQRIWAIYD